MAKQSVRIGEILSPSYFILGPVQSKRITEITNLLRLLTDPPISVKLRKKTHAVASYDHTKQRAVVLEDSSWNGKEWIHHLLLVDVGKLLDTPEVWEAPEKVFQMADFAAFQFALDCVVPVCDEETTCHAVASLLNDKKLKCVIKKLRNDALFIGDILFGGESLTNYLLQHNMAVSDSKRFAEFVPTYTIYLKNSGRNTERKNSLSPSRDSFKTASSSPPDAGESDTLEGSFVTAGSSSPSINDSTTTEESSKCIGHVERKQSEISHSIAENSEHVESNLLDAASTRQTAGSEMSGSYRILVRKPADESDLGPKCSLRQSALTVQLGRALKSAGVKNIFPVGAYALPAIARGRNTAVIDPKGQGKTFSSIVGVMDQLFRLKTDEIPSENGPLAIFLCKSSKSARKIFQQCLKFASFCDEFKPVVKCILGSNEETVKIDVGTGCEVLISTPPCLVRILRDRIWTNLRRLRWLVIDEADELLEPPFLVEMSSFRLMLQNHAPEKIQWVVLARAWTPAVRKLVFSLDSHILLINCHLEASYYAKIKQTVQTTEAHQKMNFLIKWLKNHQKQRVAVVCSINEVNEVAAHLTQHGLKYIVADHDMDHMKLSQIKNDWAMMETGLLVCSDSVLLLLKIFDATCLVNYSIPDQKDAFTYRYSLLMQNFRDHYQPDKAVVEVEALNFLDENVCRQLPVLVKFFQRFGKNVNPALLEMVEKIQIEQEELKRNMPLCDDMLSRGVCSSARDKKCFNRHIILPEIDALYEYHNRELVFDRVLVQDGAGLWAHLISSEDAFGNKINFFDFTEDIQKTLKEYYAEEREVLAKVHVGDLCAYFDDGEYFRAEVLHSNSKYTNKLQLIDSGKLMVVNKKSPLMVLPDELKNFPRQAVKMHMANLIPIDFDEKFDEQSSKRLQTLFNKPLEKNQQWRANVCIPFKSALIVESVRVVSWMACVEKFVDTGVTAAGELLKNGLAIEDKNHLYTLTGMCVKAGFNLPAVPRKSVLSVKPKWAHLDINNEDSYPTVNLSYAFNTKQVYVINTKHVSQLNEVEKLCEQEGDALLEQGLKYKIRIGNICLAKTHCGWNRARVEGITEDIAQCYMVDHGDILGVELSNIVRIPEKLVNQLPFQAVECILGGVKFSDSEEFLDYVLEDNSGGFYVKGERLTEKPKLTKGPLYKVTLLSFQGICLNKKLVDEGVLEADDETNSEKFLEGDEIVDVSASKSEESEDPDDDLMEELFNSVPYDVKKQFSEICKADPNEAMEKLMEMSEDLTKQNLKAITEMSSIKDSPEGPQAIENKQSEQVNPSQPCPKKTVDTSARTELQEDEDDEAVSTKGLTARVLWCQTEKNIILKIMVPGVKEKTIWASHRYIGVKLINHTGARYLTKIKFFGMIHYRYIRSHIGPSSFDVYCPKMVLRAWPCLTLQRNRNIQFDPEAIRVTGDEPLGRRHVIDDPCQIEREENDSSEDENAYCQELERELESCHMTDFY